MAVVTLYGKGVKNPSAIPLPEAVFAEGNVHVASSGSITITNGDSINSLVYLARVPSNAILLPLSTLLHGAVTGVSDFDIGLYKDGALVDVDILADGLTLASAGSKNVLASVATGAIGQRVWELAGAAYDPGSFYDIVGTLKAAATATAVIESFVYYATKR